MKAMFPAPQDKFVELCHDNENDAGRYAVAKIDIKAGDLVLLAAPCALSVNPNETVSAMYMAAKIEKPNSTVGKRRNTSATLSTTTTKSSCGKQPDGTLAAYPPTHSVALCCSCMQVIPVGTLLLNYETIRQVSVDVAAELADEMERQQCSLSPDHTNPTEDGIEDTGAGAMPGDHKANKKWQKPTRSTRMRSKGYIALKATLAAQREAAAAGSRASEESRRGDWFHAAQPLVWPERAIPSQPRGGNNNNNNNNNKSGGHTEDKDEAGMIGCCGCAGCGVVMYCSAHCWAEYHSQHVSSGECRALRHVYPELMRMYFTKQVPPRGRIAAPQMWDPTSWMRQIGKEPAWEVQSLLLVALVANRCAVDGFAAHLAESAAVKDLTNRCIGTQDGIVDTLSAPPEVHVERSDGHPITHTSSVTYEGNSCTHNHHINDLDDVVGLDCDSSGAPSAVRCATASRGFATESEIPREVEKIRATREKLGVPLEVLDASAAESQTGAEADWLAPRYPHWRDVARLVTNLSVLPKDFWASTRDFYRTFARHVAPRLGFEVSATAFGRLCAAVNCNGFGVYNAKDECLGVGLYPAASYFNHSCRPNLCRVMRGGRVAAFYAIRDIERGEQLSICYVDVQETSTAERRRLLLTNYRFYCQCERCTGGATGAAGVQLCVECTTRGYMRPLQGLNEAECTTCRTRKPWQTLEA